MTCASRAGTIYLFGKVELDAPLDAAATTTTTTPAAAPKTTTTTTKRGGGGFVSICVAVKHVERVLFVLPRALASGEVDEASGAPKRRSMLDVHKELTGLLVPSIIPKATTRQTE